MKIARIHSLIVLSICIIFTMSGCIAERFAWSPDGKKLAFIGTDDQKLWLWDSNTKKAVRIEDKEVSACRFLSNDYLLYGIKTDKDGQVIDLIRYNMKNGETAEIAMDTCLQFAIADTGLVYTIQKNDTQNFCDLWEREPLQNTAKIVYSSTEEFSYVNTSPSGKRIVINNSDKSTTFLEYAGGSFKPFSTSPENMVWPVWIDEENLTAVTGDNNNDEGTLVTFSLKDMKPEFLAEHVFLWDIPSLMPDRKSVIFTEKSGDDCRLARVDLTSRKKEYLTEDPIGSCFAVPSFDGKKIAYLKPGLADDKIYIGYVMDTVTHKSEMLWHNDEERYLNMSEILFENGYNTLAQSLNEDLFKHFPQTTYERYVQFQMMQIQLAFPEPNLDRAFEAFQQVGNLKNKANRLLWPEKFQIASDPADDVITRFATKDSKKKFEYDTDSTRDLLGLSAQWSKDTLFLKIDYNSSKDLSGLVFQDTYILFDLNSPNDGYRQITSKTAWDRGAERVVIFRHWFSQERNSQYDVTLLNEKGESIARMNAAGFALPSSSFLKVLGEIQYQSDSPENSGKEKTADVKNLQEKGSLIISIPRDILGLAGNQKVTIQVCTSKGGIESFEGKERQIPSLNKEECDISDAFGAENTKARIERDYTASGKFIIKEFAAVLDMN